MGLSVFGLSRPLPLIAIELTLRRGREAAEELAPAFLAGEPGLLVASAQSRFGKPDGAANPRLARGRVRLVHIGEGFLPFARDRVDFPAVLFVILPEAEQDVGQSRFHRGSP